VRRTRNRSSPNKKRGARSCSSFDAKAWRPPASVVRAEWPDRRFPTQSLSTLMLAVMRRSPPEMPALMASASGPSLTSSSEYKRSTADEEYCHAGARTNPKDADRPRANRPQPVHALPQNARRHVSEASSDQRALLRLARVCDQSLDRGSLRVHRGKDRRSDC
jgi:hypothetical protein